MSFRVGDIVDYFNKQATVIAVSYNDISGKILIGWRPGEPTTSGAWIFANTMALKPNPEKYSIIRNMKRDFVRAYWIFSDEAILVESCKSDMSAKVKMFTRVNQRTLRKRMRDQIAQSLYK